MKRVSSHCLSGCGGGLDGLRNGVVRIDGGDWAVVTGQR